MIVGAGALFFSLKTNRFLFLLRQGAKFSGTWNIIGGKVEPHESLLSGLVREITEEIGFLPNIQKYIPLEIFTSQDQNFQYNTFICIVAEEFLPQLNHEHDGYCWVSIDFYPKPLHPGLYETIKLDEIRAKISLIQNLRND